MKKNRFCINKLSIFISIIIIIISFLLVHIVIHSNNNEAIAGGYINEGSLDVIRLADEKIEVTIALQNEYTLTYKNSEFLIESSGKYYPDNDLFSILEISGDGSNLTKNDIIVIGTTTIKSASTYNNITFTVENDIYQGSLTTSITVSKYEITLSETNFNFSKTKTYDATETIDISQNIINGINGETITLSSINAEYSNKNVGENKEYTISLSNNNNNYHVLPTSFTFYDGIIDKADLSISLPDNPSIFYGQDLSDIELEYNGFADMENKNNLSQIPTITNTSEFELSPENNGNITIQINENGSADNYTLLVDTSTKSLIIGKANVEITFSSSQLQYINNNFIDINNNPIQVLFNLMSFENSVIGQAIIENIDRSDIIFNISTMKDASDYNFNLSIDNSNIYYKIDPVQNEDFVITRAPLSILPSEANTYFDIIDTKIYDATFLFENISIKDGATINGISETINFTSVDAIFLDKNVNTSVDYNISFEIDNTNYQPQVINMTGAFSGEIQQYSIMSFDATNFVGIKNEKTYNSSSTMELYDLVVYVYDASYIDVIDYVSSKINYYFNNLAEPYFANTIALKSFVQSITNFITDQENYTDDYVVFRIDRYTAINTLYENIDSELNPEIGSTSREHILSRDAIDFMIENFDEWLLDDVRFENNFVQYSGPQIANLIFTEFNEVICLDRATFINGTYNNKNAEQNKSYTIYCNNSANNNYIFSFNEILGNDGIINPAYVAIDYPLLTKIYGEENVENYEVYFVNENDINSLLSTSITANGNEIELPYTLRNGTLENHFNINSILSYYYQSDIDNNELSFLNFNNQRILNNFALDNPAEELNCYKNITEVGGPYSKHLLELITDEFNNNYIHISLLSFYDSENYYSEPEIIVEPKVMQFDNGTGISKIRNYNATPDVDISPITLENFVGDDSNYYSINVSAKFFDLFNSEVNIVGNGYIISNFDFSVEYIADEFKLGSYNYIVDKNSFLNVVNFDYDFNIEIKINYNDEYIWVSLSDYIASYSNYDISDIKLSSENPDYIKIDKAELLFSIATDGQVENLVYGNDITKSIIIDLQNFYQNQEEYSFSFSYDIYDAINEISINENQNNQATQFLPREENYQITLNSLVSVSNNWANDYGNNYNINYSSNSADFVVVKGILIYSINDVEKAYGDLDPNFSFESINGARDSDLISLTNDLQRSIDTQEYENAGLNIIIELKGQDYYNFDSISSNGILKINKKDLTVNPEYFALTYGDIESLSTNYIYTTDYVVDLPNEISDTLKLDYECKADGSLDAGDNYIHDVVDISFNVNTGENDAVNYNIILGLIDNVFKINKYIINIDLSSQINSYTAYQGLEKTYDEENISIETKENSLYFDYNNNLIGLDFPREKECYHFMLPELKYDERLFYAKFLSNDENFGNKSLYIDTIILAKKDQFYNVIQCNMNNYNFIIVSEATINKRDFQINTIPESGTYYKTYDNLPYVLHYDNETMPINLVEGHYINETDLCFVSNGVDRNIEGYDLLMDCPEGGYRIYNSNAEDVTDNYNLTTTEFGKAVIEARRIKLKVENEINYNYDGNKVGIDLDTGIISIFDGTDYTTLMEGDNPRTEIIDLYYDTDNNVSPNTLATVLVEGHSITGSLITATSNAIASYMVCDNQIIINNTDNNNYAVDFGEAVRVIISKRIINVDINPEEYTLGYPRKQYDGTKYSIALDTATIDNLLDGHMLTGERLTNDENVSTYESGNDYMPKKFTISQNLKIEDAENNNVFDNYTINFIDRFAIIERREVSININLDTSEEERQKIYDGNIFMINITTAMIDNIITGETIVAGNLSSIDSNVYTLDDEGNVLYNGEEFQSKELYHFATNQDIRIEKSGNDSSYNYNISCGGNFIDILPKLIYVDMSKEYSSMQFVYTGEYIEIPITNLMLKDYYDHDVFGLIYGQSVIGSSENIVSVSKNAGIDIDVIYPDGNIDIVDGYGALNYDMNYANSKIEITKRLLEININKKIDVVLTKIYDSELLTTELDSTMDNNSLNSTSGLVDGHLLSGLACTYDGFVSGIKSLQYINLCIYDTNENEYTENYLITHTNVYASITKKDLYIDIDIATADGHKKIYDEQIFVVDILDNMLTGLEGEDCLIVDGSEKSKRQTLYTDAKKYYLSDPNDAEGTITIKRDGLDENLAYNYNLIYQNNGQIEIKKRPVIITVRNTENYGLDDEDDFISGFKNVYYDNFYIVDYNNYHIDNADEENYYNIVDTHHIDGGSRITQYKYANKKIKLIENENILIKNSLGYAVTSNYDISYQDSYFEIYKRKIKLDVAKNQQGNTNEYDVNNMFLYNYDRNKFEIELQNYMVYLQDDFLSIVNGHQIKSGKLESENAEVERDDEGNVITKELLWSSDEFAIKNATNEDVTENYEIDKTCTNLNFVQRVVKIIPQTLSIDINKGVQSLYTKAYDGEVFTVNIVNAMVIENRFYNDCGGFIGEINEYGQLINKDNIRINSGNLVTEDCDVLLAEDNITPLEKALVVGKNIIIENPQGEDVTNNYCINYYMDIKDSMDWYNAISGGYHDYLPKALIIKRNMTLTISNTEKIKKYYDGTKLDISFSFENGSFQYSGTVINEDLSQLLILSNLVEGEKASFRLFTSDGKVNSSKNWNYSNSEFNVTKADLQESISNYNINVQNSNFGEIIKRKICIDINKGTNQIKQYQYTSHPILVQLENDMVLENSYNTSLLNDITDSLGLLENHNVMGSRKSISSNVGIFDLIKNEDFVILDNEGFDITSSYMISFALNQKVEIIPAPLTIDVDNSDVSKTKIYNGEKFVIELSNPNVISGLVSPNHVIRDGVITTLDKNVANGKTAICNINDIEISNFDEESGIYNDVTTNYTFNYVERVLQITPKEISIKGNEKYYKAFNNKTDVNLLQKHYTFEDGDICGNDQVYLINYTANFSSKEAGGAGEELTVNNLEIDNKNYYLGNTFFVIIGQIVKFTPIVDVENCISIDNELGVEFIYDGQQKRLNYTVLGLEDVYVNHIVKYRDTTQNEGVFMDSPPIDAGLYEMIIISDDEDYQFWNGEKIIIKIYPAEIEINITGELSQTYGEVNDLSANALSTNNLNEPINLEILPIYASQNYSYPEAGEYQISANYNIYGENPNYSSATKTVVLSINKRKIRVNYGSLQDYVYDGTIKDVIVNIDNTQVLIKDRNLINENLIQKNYGGNYNIVSNAGLYNLTVTLNNNNYEIENNYIEFEVLKKDLTVSVLINNASRAIINEGDPYNIILQYKGFVGNESIQYLLKPAYIPYIPKTAMTEFEVLPFGANSLNYNFTYVPAYLTILKKSVSNIEDYNGIALISGDYSSYTTLNASKIEPDVSDPEYYLLQQNIEKNLSSTDLLNKYNIEMTYRLKIESDDQQNQETNTMTMVKLKLDSKLQKESEFMILHFDEYGNYEVINGIKDGEYLVFNTSSMGDFTIMTPKEGLNKSAIILLFIAPIFVFIIGLLLYTLFRRKY